MMYRAPWAVIDKDQTEYKKQYKPFKPFLTSSVDLDRIARSFQVMIETQNGQDVDDYVIDDNNKVEKYLCNTAKGSRTLLLGVGSGRETKVAKDLGLDVVGTTLGSRNIDFGINKLGLSAEEHVECLNESLPFPTDSFDVVAGFQIFEHVMSPLLFLLEQNRVLRKNGRLILEWPPGDQFSMEDNPHHQVCFSPGQALALLQKAGFIDIKLYYDDLSPILEENLWSEKHSKMLCADAKRGPVRKSYVSHYRNLKQ